MSAASKLNKDSISKTSSVSKPNKDSLSKTSIRSRVSKCEFCAHCVTPLSTLYNSMYMFRFIYLLIFYLVSTNKKRSEVKYVSDEWADSMVYQTEKKLSGGTSASQSKRDNVSLQFMADYIG